MPEVESQEIHQWSNVRNQYYASIAGSLITLTHGTIAGWTSPALPKLASEDTPLVSGPLTNEQISWIGSIGPIGVVFGSFLFGSITSLEGSKRAALLLTIPSIIFWILIYFGNVYYHILLARFIGGWTFGGMITTIVLYITEIANDNVRGRLGIFCSLFGDIGILFSYILGTTVGYRIVPCICVIVPICFAIVFSAFPNTPQYYLSKGQFHKAEEAFKYYKVYKGISKLEQEAFERDFERLRSIATARRAESRFSLADLWNRNALKGLGIGITLSIFAQCTANLAITCYAVLIIEKSGTTLDPYVSSILCAVTPIFGSLLSSYLADILGRRLLNFISLTGSAAGLFGLSLYQYLKLSSFNTSAFEWVPVLCLSFVVFISNAGIIPLSILCSVENLPPKVRTFGMMIVSSSISVFSFTSLKMLPILMEELELYGCMMIYGTGCIIGAIFVLFVLKETSGQSLIGSYDRTDNRVVCSDDRIPLIIVPKLKSSVVTYNTFSNICDK